MIQFYFIFLDAVNDDVKTHLKNIPKRISHTCTNTDTHFKCENYQTFFIEMCHKMPPIVNYLIQK